MLDEVRCTGEESYLLECGHAPWGQTDCSHHEDVGVVCSHRENLSAIFITYCIMLSLSLSLSPHSLSLSLSLSLERTRTYACVSTGYEFVCLEGGLRIIIIIIINRFYIALFSALEQTHCARM